MWRELWMLSVAGSCLLPPAHGETCAGPQCYPGCYGATAGCHHPRQRSGAAVQQDTIACWGEEMTTHLTVPTGTKAFVP